MDSMTDYTGPILAILALAVFVLACMTAPWWLPVGMVALFVAAFVWW